MTDIFLHIVNMSITASILAVIVLLLRLLLKKAPKWISVLLWGLVAIRLICPFTVESSFSLMPKTDWIEEESVSEDGLFLNSAPDSIPAIDFSSIGENVTAHYYPIENPEVKIHRGINTSSILSCVWIVGMAFLFLHTVISTIRLRRSIGAAIRVQDNVWESSAVDSPFVLGMIRPCIYIPRGMTEEKLAYVIAHEEAHIRRKDHWWKPLGFILLTIHWFNPVIWLAYILLCRDIEMACDERVIRDIGDVERADYSEALLECSVKRSMISACPLAFGEVGVKQRIKSVLNYRKPAFWIIAVAVIACIVAAVCFLTNPQPEAETPDGSYTLEIYFDLDYELTAPLKESNDVKVVIDDLMNVWVYDGKELMSGGLYKEIKLNAQNFDALFENTAVDIGLVMDLRKDIRSSWVMTYTASENGHHPYLVIVDDNEQVYLVVADYISGTPKSISGIFKLHKNIPEQLEAIDFVDFIENQDGMYAYVDRFIEHKDFPGVSFHYTPQKIIAKTANGENTILSEETIWNCYFSDVTGDGKADLCATVTKIKPSITRRVVVYDYAENRKYEFSDRDKNHYILSNENGFLTVNRYANADAYENEPVSKGSLTIINDNLVLFAYAVKTPDIGKSPLTLEDVITLSAKGHDLTWEDFYEYKFIETGSGLYIRKYEIDETFSVWIGGGSPIGTPMYIYLTANDLDTRIDIRDGGVEEFIKKMSPKQTGKEIENIIFHSDRGGASLALEDFYSDDKYDYYFPTIRSYVIIVYYKDGTQQTVKEALAEGKITIADLDRFNIGYYREPRQDYEPSRLLTVTEVSAEALLGTEYYEYIHDQNEYTRYILISTAEKITDVRVTDIILDAGLEFGDVLYILSALDSNKPLLLGVVFYGDLTSYGIVFNDSDGTTHRFIISESGKDGAVVVQEYYFFGDR